MIHTRGMAKGFPYGPALVTLLIAATAPSVVKAGPRPLTDAEMDGVTAAGIAVEVDVYARARGHIAHTRTASRALTRIVEGRIQVGAGFAEGQAYACCGSGSSVAVGSSAAGAGDVVEGGSFSHVFHGAALTADGAFERFAFGYSAALLLTASFGGQRDSRARGDPGRRLIGVGQLLSENRLITGFAFAPVYAAGLRWRAARHLAGPGDLSPATTAGQIAPRRLTRANQIVTPK